MKFSEIWEAIVIALDSIKANKLRSFLASLGVVIGISFVIIMGWALAGLDKVLLDTINMIGSDMLYVDKWDWSGGQNWKLLQARKPITLEQANEFIKRVKSAEVAIPIAKRHRTVIKYGNLNFEGISVQGSLSEYGLTPAGAILDGRFFSPSEDMYSANVVVFAYNAYYSVFPDGDGIGKTVKINGHKFYVIGVVKKQGTALLDFVDNQVFVPLSSFLGCFGKYRRSLSIGVKAGSPEMLDEVRTETIGIMRGIRGLEPWEELDFSVNETKTFEKSTDMFRLYVWGIGIGMTVLSFIVGIIGITNIMFVSVAERTKEIGIRKAIGAPKRSILFQFIIESAILCLIGSAFSFIGCSVLIYVVATFLPKAFPSISFLSPYIPLKLLYIASFVSIIVGILAGLIPAIRASNLDPVDSLRYE